LCGATRKSFNNGLSVYLLTLYNRLSVYLLTFYLLTLLTWLETGHREI